MRFANLRRWQEIARSPVAVFVLGSRQPSAALPLAQSESNKDHGARGLARSQGIPKNRDLCNSGLILYAPAYLCDRGVSEEGVRE